VGPWGHAARTGGDLCSCSTVRRSWFRARGPGGLGLSSGRVRALGDDSRYRRCLGFKGLTDREPSSSSPSRPTTGTMRSAALRSDRGGRGVARYRATLRGRAHGTAEAAVVVVATGRAAAGLAARFFESARPPVVAVVRCRASPTSRSLRTAACSTLFRSAWEDAPTREDGSDRGQFAFERAPRRRGGLPARRAARRSGARVRSPKRRPTAIQPLKTLLEQIRVGPALGRPCRLAACARRNKVRHSPSRSARSASLDGFRGGRTLLMHCSTNQMRL